MGTIKEAYTINFGNFTSRSSRKEYWFVTIINVSVITALFLISTCLCAAFEINTDFAYLLPGLACLHLFIPGLAVSVRRLHDIDRSRWWYMLALIPYLGFLAHIAIGCVPGTSGPNKYGYPASSPVPPRPRAHH
ncbi:MAG: DUF805 domain-containing protein [Deltaproteobacteria bacterium]|jgi:uncharacterized membrane protein YhaH (DUF805 family)|nr:DUF805 domain-containing protein [Deltaproteobacteria bacterium]